MVCFLKITEKADNLGRLYRHCLAKCYLNVKRLLAKLLHVIQMQIELPICNIEMFSINLKIYGYIYIIIKCLFDIIDTINK